MSDMGAQRTAIEEAKAQVEYYEQHMQKATQQVPTKLDACMLWSVLVWNKDESNNVVSFSSVFSSVRSAALQVHVVQFLHCQCYSVSQVSCCVCRWQT